MRWGVNEAHEEVGPAHSVLPAAAAWSLRVVFETSPVSGVPCLSSVDRGTTMRWGLPTLLFLQQQHGRSGLVFSNNMFLGF